MRGMPPTAPVHDDDGASPSPASPTTKTDTEMGTAGPMPAPIPMGGTASPNPGAKQQPAPRVARRTKSSMDVDSTSPSDFIQKRPSTSTLVQPTSSRARVGDGQLVLSVAARAKPGRGDRDDAQGGDSYGNKKQKSVGFGTQAASAITNTNKKNASTTRRCRRRPLGITPIIHRDRSPHTAVSETTRRNTEPVRTDNKWRRR